MSVDDLLNNRIGILVEEWLITVNFKELEMIIVMKKISILFGRHLVRFLFQLRLLDPLLNLLLFLRPL